MRGLVARAQHSFCLCIVGDRQELVGALFDPLRGFAALALWTVPVAARVVGVLLVVAALAAIDVSAELGGAAAQDIAQYLALHQGKRVCARELFAVQPYDVSHFKSVTSHASLLAELIEWADDVAKHDVGDVRIDKRRLKV